MIWSVLRYWAVLLAACVVAAAYWKGGADNEARHTSAALAEAGLNAAVAEKLAAAEEANRILTRALEDAAYAEPPSASCGLPLSRVLRLRER